MKILFLMASVFLPLTAHAQSPSPMVMCPIGSSSYNVPDYVCSGLQAGFAKLSSSARDGFPTGDDLERCAIAMRQNLIEVSQHQFYGLCIKLWVRSYSDYQWSHSGRGAR